MMTRQEAEAIYDSGKETVVSVLLKMDARIDALEARIIKLENQIVKNSRNSSKPPSTDGFKNPKPKSLRKKSNRKCGGQPGHKGHTLKMAKKPDHTEVHKVKECECCHKSLADQPADSIEKRQVFDLPPDIRLMVTEHQCETKHCTCGHINKSEFPEEINAPVQYGPRVKAAAVYLKNYQFLPYERASELLDDLFGCPIGKGTLVNIVSKCNVIAEIPVAQIKEQITESSVAHFDESGSRVEGTRWWVHSSSTPTATYYDVHRKRGSEAMNEINILPSYYGRAIHDFWKPYYTYSCMHGLCNAHHLRELTFVHEQHKQNWADNMIKCLLDIKHTVEKVKQTAKCLDENQIDEFEKYYKQVIAEGYEQNPLPPLPANAKKKKGPRKKTKPRNLLERLDKHRAEALAFMYDFNVPFDNNPAERDIRMMKVQQKISGTFRSENGAKSFCRIRSYISTARKNAVGAFDALTLLFNGRPFVPVADLQ